MTWTDIVFKPDPETCCAASEAWHWLIGDPKRILLSSMFGGLFFEKQSGEVFWLECGSGEVAQVADSVEAFDRFMSGERDEAWNERINWRSCRPLFKGFMTPGRSPDPINATGWQFCRSSTASMRSRISPFCRAASG
jgi:hypothetical protein